MAVLDNPSDWRGCQYLFFLALSWRRRSAIGWPHSYRLILVQIGIVLGYGPVLLGLLGKRAILCPWFGFLVRHQRSFAIGQQPFSVAGIQSPLWFARCYSGWCLTDQKLNTPVASPVDS
jgi:hypothetical protein